MNTTIAVPMNPVRSLAHAWRTIVVSLAVAILIAVSFLVGHATASPSHIAPTRPAVQSTVGQAAVPSVGQASTFPCRRAC